MTLEQRVNQLEKQFDNLNKAFLQAQRNQVPITAKVDDSANQVKAITPYTETKTAYIGDTEIVFSDVPNGAWYVSFNNDVLATKITRDNGTLIVEFLPLEEVTQVTITVQ